MSRKFKIIISALIVALLLTVGIGVTVLAQEPDPTDEVGEGGIMARVAAILEIEEDDLVPFEYLCYQSRVCKNSRI